MASADKARKGQLRQFEARQAHHAYRAARTRKDQFIGIVSAVAAITVSALSLWAYGTIGPGKPAVVAEYEVDVIEMEIDALNAARNLDIDTAEAVMRVELGSKVSEMSSKELKRDLLVYAKKNPRLF